MKLVSNLIRALIGIALGVIGFALIPSYGGPFIGCEGSRWLTLELGCSYWPEILRGALFVLPIAILAPRHWILPVIAVALLFILSFLGGIEGIQTGRYLSIGSIADIYHLFLGSYQNFLGGFLVIIVWGIILRNLDAKPNKGLNRTPVISAAAKPDKSDGGAG